MANRYAVATGNWSDTATWDGGTLPGVADVVRPNTYTVTIDQDITVTELRSDAASPAVAGGSFVVSSTGAGTRTLTVSTAIGGPTPIGATGNFLTISATSGTVVLATPGLAGGAFNETCVAVTGAGVTVDASSATVTGGTSTSGSGVLITAAATVTVGNLVSGTSPCIDITTNGAVVTCGDGYSNSSGNLVRCTAASTITTGDLESDSSSTVGYMANLSGGATLICGEILGSSGHQNAFGINIGAGGCSVTATRAEARLGPAIYTTSSETLISIAGPVVASGSSPAITISSISLVPTIRAKGPLYHGPNNRVPIFAHAWMVYSNETISWTVKDDSLSPATGADVTLSNALAGVPAVTDVRAGTSFGGGGSLTGTLAVPAPSSVAAGVATDDTVGTAVLTADTLWNHEVSTGVAAKDRLLATSTVDSTGAQIAAATDAP